MVYIICLGVGLPPSNVTTSFKCCLGSFVVSSFEQQLYMVPSLCIFCTICCVGVYAVVFATLHSEYTDCHRGLAVVARAIVPLPSNPTHKSNNTAYYMDIIIETKYVSYAQLLLSHDFSPSFNFIQVTSFIFCRSLESPPSDVPVQIDHSPGGIFYGTKFVSFSRVVVLTVSTVLSATRTSSLYCVMGLCSRRVRETKGLTSGPAPYQGPPCQAASGCTQ